MSHKGLIGSLFVSLATILAMTVAIPSHASAMSQVPFRATLTEIAPGDQTALCPGQTPPPQYLCVTVIGTGQATHLGSVQELAVVQVDILHGPPPNEAGCAPEVRTSTLTAANGDQITLQGSGQACSNALDTHATALDSWSVIGGTGRFAGATGSGTDTASIDRTTNPTTSVTYFTGTISY